jgi:diphthine synthase
MLYLISLGLRDEKDMSLRALETAKKCKLLYAEFYTNKTAATPASLSRLIGKKVKELQREGMEEGAADIIEEAKKKNIGVFVPGDVLSATTHLMMLAEAQKAGVKVKIIHGSSIFTAIAETGLQLYKFGRTVTLTDPFLQSTKRAIQSNYRSRLHTLVLLDIGMDAIKGLELLSSFMSAIEVVVACQLGKDSQLIRYGKVDNLLKLKELKGKIPAAIAIPGELHFTEEEFLQSLGPKPKKGHHPQSAAKKKPLAKKSPAKKVLKKAKPLPAKQLLTPDKLTQ